MKLFLINERRLLHIIDYDVRKSALGVLNWFVDQDELLNIVIKVRDVDYLYQQPSMNIIHPELLAYITPSYEVLGFYEPSDLSGVDVVEEYSETDYFEVKNGN